jgi:hypothetical protein
MSGLKTWPGSLERQRWMISTLKGCQILPVDQKRPALFLCRELASLNGATNCALADAQ